MGRTKRDVLAECVVELVYEYKKRIEFLNSRIDYLAAECKEQEKKRITAVEQANTFSDAIGEIADIIAGIIEHTEDGDIKIYLSNIAPENKVKLERLFKLLDIPMTADQIKDGDIIEED